MTKYTFKTIVAPESVRAEFTVLRDRLKTTDKQLMQAMFNLATSDMGTLEHELEGLKEVAMNLKKITAISKGEAPGVTSKAAKLKEKTPKVPKKTKKAEPVVQIVDDGDDLCCVVVDGTK
jgi:hypothetical protein